MMAQNQNKPICLGAIVGVHGIKGEVKVKSWTEVDRDISSYGVLQNEDGSKNFDLRVTGHSKELLRCKIKGVDNRNAAEELIGTRLYINRTKLSELQTEEYYQADLIGLEVVSKLDHSKLGSVCGIYNFGAGDIIEIKLAATGKTEMLPFTEEYVPEICISEGYIAVSTTALNFADDEENNDEC